MELSCTGCGRPLAVASDRAGNLSHVHAEPPADGHAAGAAPVTVTYRHDGMWTDVSCDEAGGPLGTVTSQEAAAQLAWTCLRRIRPPRGVIERHEGTRA